VSSDVHLRRLEANELARVAEIDRTEQIDALYIQHGTRLELREGDFSARPWRTDGQGEHSVAAHLAELERHVKAGGATLGAFAAERLAGIGVVIPHLRPGIAQLAFLHVSNGYRGEGVGGRLCDEMEQIAREGGATAIVVSATPSRNTVQFYGRRGYEPMAEPLPELFELEPEDVHMRKPL
jgi:predicted N-acetyltransferase YhbS